MSDIPAAPRKYKQMSEKVLNRVTEQRRLMDGHVRRMRVGLGCKWPKAWRQDVEENMSDWENRG